MLVGFILCSMVLVVLAIAVLAQDVGYKSEPPPLGKLIDVRGYRVRLYCTGAGSERKVSLLAYRGKRC